MHRNTLPKNNELFDATKYFSGGLLNVTFKKNGTLKQFEDNC